MVQIHIRYETIDRLERITKRKFSRGGDKLINEAMDILEKGGHTIATK